MAKKFFDSKSIDYVVYDTGITEIFDEMIKRNPRARTVPQIFIDDDLVGGYTDLIEKYTD